MNVLVGESVNVFVGESVNVFVGDVREGARRGVCEGRRSASP